MGEFPSAKSQGFPCAVLPTRAHLHAALDTVLQDGLELVGRILDPGLILP
jgi:hypothetical protein